MELLIEDFVVRAKSSREVRRLIAASTPSTNLVDEGSVKRRCERGLWRGEQRELLDHRGWPYGCGSHASLHADDYSAGMSASWGFLLRTSLKALKKSS